MWTSVNPNTAVAWKDARGFTLMEVVVSLAIMAIGLLAVYRLQAQNLDFQAESYFMTLAGQLARQRVAEIEARPDMEEGHSSGDFREWQPGFLYEEDVIPVGSIRNLFRIRVTVREETDSTGRRYSVETLHASQAP